MSADLLRRAAAKLREHAEAATPGPWRVESSENWDDTITYSVLGVADDNGVTPVPFRTTTEDAGYHSQAEADVNLAAMLHPPVALALADWLDDAAARTGIPEYPSYGLPEKAMAVARAVLREEES